MTVTLWNSLCIRNLLKFYQKERFGNFLSLFGKIWINLTYIMKQLCFLLMRSYYISLCSRSHNPFILPTTWRSQSWIFMSQGVRHTELVLKNSFLCFVDLLVSYNTHLYTYLITWSNVYFSRIITTKGISNGNWKSKNQSGFGDGIFS